MTTEDDNVRPIAKRPVIEPDETVLIEKGDRLPDYAGKLPEADELPGTSTIVGIGGMIIAVTGILILIVVMAGLLVRTVEWAF